LFVYRLHAWSGIWRATSAITGAAGTIAGEHRERGEAAVEKQNQTPPFDLGNLPATNVVTDSHTHNAGRRTGADNGARFIAIHHNAEQGNIRGR
jgi:hypothetical protein